MEGGPDRISIALKPEGLGRVTVEMSVQSDGTVAAHVSAENPQTLALLQADQGSLQQSLTDAGLRADPSSLTFSSFQDNGSSGAGNGAFADANGNGNNSGNGRVANNPYASGTSDPAVIAAQQSAAAAARGGLDISV